MGRTQRSRLVAMAATVTVIATATYVPAAWGAGDGGASADTAKVADAAAAEAADSEIVSTVAPVLKPNGTSSRTYSTNEMRQIETEGGDPAVLEYWTPERMAAAKPLDAPGDPALVKRMAQDLAADLAAGSTAGPASTLPSSPAGDLAEGGTTVTRPVGPEESDGAATNSINRWPITVGKLFIGGYGSGSYCSASALNTKSKRVVITAGHCVHSGRGGSWRSNLVFVPRFNGEAENKTPYGTFQARTLHTFRTWIEKGGTNQGWYRDVGMITTYANGRGQRVVSAVGGNGLKIDQYYRWPTTTFGYPYNLDDGQVMWGCQDMTRKSGVAPRTSLISGCNFGEGSSGGPWVWHYSDRTRLGYVRGVTSYGTPQNRSIGSPHFDSAVRRLAVSTNG
ncbi:trypsin-like serine peptidase [Promicromonospora sp. NPDC057138]|uniref:trypsin-like serine peptidase n=1 Tax=Promicromonospora sp. NPDC057138 TaxID=3346031 RepID=UPI003625164E